jgi:site-specific DNA recombinase
LPFYLAAPEVENDRRASDALMGMRKAKKEGQYMSTALTGYAK